jgi:membrane protein
MPPTSQVDRNSVCLLLIMSKLKEKFKSIKPIKKTIGFLQGIDVIKDTFSLYQFIKLFIRKIDQDDIWEKANAVAFSFTLSIFPAVIFLFTLIPYVQLFFPEFQQEAIMAFLEELFPPSVYDFTSQTIEDIISKSRGGLLTFGFIMALYLATNGMMSLMKAFNACYQTKELRGFLKTRMMAVFLTFCFAITLLVATLLLTLGETIINLVYPERLLGTEMIIYMIYLLRILVVFAMFFIVIAVIYYFAPAIHDRWSFFSWGSLLASSLSVLVSFAFSAYITNFGTYNKLYGSIGALIALMVWFYILAVIILLGFELNATIDRAKIVAKLGGDDE